MSQISQMLSLLFDDPQTISKILAGMRRLYEKDAYWFFEENVDLAELDLTVEHNQLTLLADANDWPVVQKELAGFCVGSDVESMLDRLYEAERLESNWTKVIEEARKLHMEKTHRFIHKGRMNQLGIGR